MPVSRSISSFVSRGFGLAILVACVVTAASGALAQAQTTGVDLGEPNYARYCEATQGSPSGGPDLNGTTGISVSCQDGPGEGGRREVDLQAACEFTYSQRPILAERVETAKFGYGCFQTSGPSGGSSQLSPSVAASPSRAQLKASLLRTLFPKGRTAKIAALLKKGGYSFTFSALTAGSVVIYWYSVPNGAHITKGSSKPTLVASAKASFAKAGTAKIEMKLTVKGKQLLKHAKRVKLTAKGIFTPTGTAGVVALRPFVLTP
jgi:hypothetical protein